jgi:stearoyl-CoA desaturase (delta-9 desaturase)
MDAQRGAGRWAADHILHHKESDQPGDLHSCKQKGKPTCHMFWVLFGREEVDWTLIPHLKKIRGIVWIEDRQWIGIVLGGGIFSTVGALLEVGARNSFMGNFVFSLLMYFFVTTLLWHGTFLINSAMHLVGKQRYDTCDESRNSLICAILTFGEGWHNNHHNAYPSQAALLKQSLSGVRAKRPKPEDLFWQGETPFERAFDWSGISIWSLMKAGVLMPLGAK